jgi:hypothetical protein
LQRELNASDRIGGEPLQGAAECARLLVNGAHQPCLLVERRLRHAESLIERRPQRSFGPVHVREQLRDLFRRICGGPDGDRCPRLVECVEESPQWLEDRLPHDVPALIADVVDGFGELRHAGQAGDGLDDFA